MPNANRKSISVLLELNLAHQFNSISNRNIPLVENDFISSFRPIYISSRVLGLLPFSLILNSNGSIQKSRVKDLDWCWFVLSICVQLVLIWFYLQNLAFWRNHLKEWGIFTVCTDINVVTQLTLQIATINLDLFNQSLHIDILKRFKIFDNKVIFIIFK